MLIDALTKAGYQHYEISNFCKPGMHSRHNSSYWQGILYLGCGAAAHSFDGTSRQWNVADIKNYIKGIETNAPCYEIEALDTPTRYNEYIMTGLRTSHGISIEEVANRFSQSFATSCKKSATPHLESGKLITEEHRIKLSREGIFVSDAIICDLMVLT
jgi:oxygen-independent coproporphyrinogen-3 oxidase